MRVKFTNELKKLSILMKLANLNGYLDTNHNYDVEGLASMIGCSVDDLTDVLESLDVEIDDEIYSDEKITSHKLK